MLFFCSSGFFPRPGYPVEQVAIPTGEGVIEQSLGGIGPRESPGVRGKGVWCVVGFCREGKKRIADGEGSRHGWGCSRGKDHGMMGEAANRNNDDELGLEEKHK
jgi:hypothetical protein